ncbi:hypothetical protein DU78_12125 [Methanosarcina mazei]|uniref:Uncharacterized protein n=2 Tax=Methanosarcina mazei TaxID=2209 RepID=A0A0F8QE00_METMZ|nr:hypothetical protein DU78_12125 [Methanosarcina mazei]
MCIRDRNTGNPEKLGRRREGDPEQQCRKRRRYSEEADGCSKDTSCDLSASVYDSCGIFRSEEKDLKRLKRTKKDFFLHLYFSFLHRSLSI